MRRLAIVSAAVFVMGLSLAGCGSTGGEMAGSGGGAKAAVEALIKEAEAALKKADSVGGEWRDSQKAIKQAKAALSKGDLAAAKKSAEQAKFQGEVGYDQATAEKNAKPWLF